MLLVHDLEQRHVAANRAASAGEARVGRVDQPVVGLAFALPAAGDDSEVGDVVGQQGSLVVCAQLEEGLVVFGFPASFGGGETVGPALVGLDLAGEFGVVGHRGCGEPRGDAEVVSGLF